MCKPIKCSLKSWNYVTAVKPNETHEHSTYESETIVKDVGLRRIIIRRRRVGEEEGE